MPISFINLVLLYLLFNIKYFKRFRVRPIYVVVAVNFVAEGGDFFLNSINAKDGSAWVYNFSLPVEFISYGLLYKQLFQQRMLRHIITAFIITTPMLSVYSFANNKSIYPFHSLVFTYECIFLLFVTLTFFIKLFLADYFYTNPLHQYYFWISTGILFCYAGGFMYLSNLSFLFKRLNSLYSNLQNLNFLLNCFLYFCIVISFRCLKAYPDSQVQSL